MFWDLTKDWFSCFEHCTLVMVLWFTTLIWSPYLFVFSFVTFSEGLVFGVYLLHRLALAANLISICFPDVYCSQLQAWFRLATILTLLFKGLAWLRLLTEGGRVGGLQVPFWPERRLFISHPNYFLKMHHPPECFRMWIVVADWIRTEVTIRHIEKIDLLTT